MLQNQSGSINQFLQNKSSRNNYSYSIKYTSPSNSKEPYFNKSIFNNNKKIVSPKIEFVKENSLLTSYNENLNLNNKYKKNIINKAENKINRSSENFPKIILTKRGMKQLTNNAFDSSLEEEKNYQQQTEKNVIRRAKSGFYESQKKEDQNYRTTSNRERPRRKIIQVSSSLPLFHDEHSDTNAKAKNEKSLYSRRNTSNIKVYYSKCTNTGKKKEYNKKNIKDNISFNERLSTYSNRKKIIINYKSSTNVNIDNQLSLENRRIYNHHSENNIYDMDKKNKNKENHNYIQITNKTIKKGEIKDEYKPSKSIFNKKNNLKLYEDTSNLNNIYSEKSKNLNKKKENNDLEKIRIISNKNNHVLYESKNLKKDKQIDDSKPNLIKVKIIGNNENRSVKNIIKFKNYMKITKISKFDKEKKLDNSKEIKDKIIKSINNKTLNNIKKEVLKNDKTEEIDNNNIIINNNVNISNKKSNYINNIQLRKLPIKNLEIKNDYNDIEELKPKNSTRKIIKDDNHSLNNKNKTINEIKKDSNPQLNAPNSNSNTNIKENKSNKKMKIKKLNKAKSNDGGIKLHNKIILEICKVSEVIFKGNKKNKVKEISQNNTTNSNIIIIINNPEHKKSKKNIISPRDDKDKKNNNPNIKTDKGSDNKEGSEKKDEKKINNIKDINNLKIKKINKNIIKNGIKINRKTFKNLSSIKNEYKNIIINKIPNENKINEKKLSIINEDKISPIIKDPQMIKKEESNSIKNNNDKNIIIEDKGDEKIEKGKEKDIINNENDNKPIENIKIKEQTENLVADDINNINNEKNFKKEIKENSEDNIKNNNLENSINNNDLNKIPENTKKETTAQNQEQEEKKEEKANNIQKEEEDDDSFPKDSIKKSEDANIDDQQHLPLDLSNSEIPLDKDEPPLNHSSSSTKNETNAFSNFNNFLSKKEPENSISTNSNQEKKPDLNNSDFNTEEIQEIKPVIQHNIERKRPVFTLPADKKRSISQGKPFHIINKYYDENFILEDDAEEGFKNYIYNNEDSKSELRDNSVLNSKDNFDTGNNSIKNLKNNSEENKNDENSEKAFTEEKKNINDNEDKNNINNEIKNEDSDKKEENNDNVDL